MSKLDKMKGFRGGVLYRAANISPTTARTWPIELGSRAGEGHKRYDSTDVVSLWIMDRLTSGARVSAGRAAAIVADLQPSLPSLILEVVQEQERKGRWRWSGGPFAIAASPPDGVTHNPGWVCIADGKRLAHILSDECSGLWHVVLPLQRIISAALLSLELVLSGEKPALEDEDIQSEGPAFESVQNGAL